MFLLEKLFQISLQPYENSNHNELHRHNPRLALAAARDVVEFHDGGPKDFEGEGHGAHHEYAYLTVAEVFLEKKGHGGHKETEG